MSVKSSHQPTRQVADGLVYLPFARHYSYAYTDLDAVNHQVAFPIPAGSIVLGIMHRVTTPFAGGTPALKVGDSSGQEVWASLNGASADDISPLVDNSIFSSQHKAATPMVPKFYATADRIIVTGTASLTAGAADLDVFFAGDEDLS